MGKTVSRISGALHVGASGFGPLLPGDPEVKRHRFDPRLLHSFQRRPVAQRPVQTPGVIRAPVLVQPPLQLQGVWDFLILRKGGLFMKKKLVRFVFKMALLGLSLSIVYAFLPPRMGTVEALKLGFSAAVLVTGVLFFLDRAIFFFGKLLRRKGNGL